MKHSPMLTVVLLLTPLAALHAAGLKRPNVVLIVCDDLNDYVAHLGGHPQARTPHMDALAQGGVSFRRSYCQDPICAPSRASFLTGIYPFRSGDFTFRPWFEFPILQNSRTLMEHFRANGYHVVGSGKLMHHHRQSDWDEYPYKADYGPFAYDGKDRVGHPSVPEPYRSIGPVDGSFAPLSDVPFGGRDGRGWIYGAWGKVKPMRYVNDDDRDPTPDERNAHWAAERIGQFAREKDGKPFFLAVGFIRPHTPLYAPKKYFDLFPLKSLQLPVIKPGDAADTHYRDVFSDEIKGLRYYRTLGQSYPTVEDGLKAFLQAYLACVAAVDDCVGTVVDAIDRSPFKDNTIVVLTADNGWNMGQKEYLFKNSPWEESCRVPLIVRAPGVAKAGGVAEHPVGLIDIYPTLVDLCGLKGDTVKGPAGRPLDGHSLRPLLADPKTMKWDGPEDVPSTVFAGEAAKTKLGAGEQQNPAKQHWSIRTIRWRYVRYNNGREELYDHDADPHEWTNLADRPQCAGVLESFRTQLAAWMRKSQDSRN
ncbi:MAG: Choline-sulfatase [Planctomycetes bacterium ADurb.Bin126]|nr:MAG: Choline-sulfatase [Planctomycetes bacterium ADurb.Bin126]HQL75110.1 sulfatase [Phycisphaerae bacterium]